uniref:hypothetical protein n=1 Tax=Thaumasiovibrio occultus TaxID=1891184 RepID=UPI000B34FD51|nr:hypothetical protein [Thaumasiovibrio occultus]
MDEWKQLTLEAKRCYQAKTYADAIALHHQAMGHVFAEFDELFQQSPQDFVAAIMVSYFNLIDNHEALNDHVSCERLFEKSLHFLTESKLTPKRNATGRGDRSMSAPCLEGLSDEEVSPDETSSALIDGNEQDIKEAQQTQQDALLGGLRMWRKERCDYLRRTQSH